ncbi:rhomboid family intramembrane serine protease [Niabella ginsengisoli]|uniref:Rhomboid family intramembrane serine protease n=1 Tax=Niabella ginsengisoli TaxID=522298 RepID=A0ABS9SF08_9BACT|nr:rhomboid family intramembrane serine protease [Niabella ginsengisoli]MCH5596949.1 rhomboid family intramembrane serine protease [Niabella ginsengisoli]
MIPIGDDNSGRTLTPYINYLLIAINVLVFVFAQGMGSNENFIMSFATVPEEILNNRDITGGGLGKTPIPVYGTIITSMFMHGGFAHIIGNMMYLLIFGDNLENVMGHARYLAFYLLCGVLATLAHVYMSSYTNTGMYTPSLGASGAIAGVLGGYILLFPKNKIRVFLIPFIIRVNAFIALGLWIALQVIEGWGAMGREGSGIAYAAHVGGFVAGLILVHFFVKRQLVRARY